MAFTPRIETPNVPAASDALPRRPGQSKDPFMLMINPRAWSWVDDVGWVPDVGMLFITPGSAGVQTPAKGTAPNAAPAVMQAERNHWVVIKDQGEYLRSLPIEKGGRCYFTKWDTPDVYFDEVTWESDTAGRNAYILSKVGTGPGALIPPCPEIMKRRKLTTAIKRLERLEKLAGDNPNNGSLKSRFKTQAARVEAMRADIEGAGAPEPKAKRAPRKAANAETEEKTDG